MHRFHLPPAQCAGASLTLTGREAHHGLRVLRLRRGERVSVLDGAGHEYLCAAAGFTRDTLRLAVTEKKSVPPLPWRVTLLQALPKGKTFETIVEKATELGARRLVPVLAERTVPQLDADRAAHKVEKWRQTAIEALKQCGAAWLPEIEPPVTPAAFLARGEQFDLALVASLQPGGAHPRDWFRRFAAQHGRRPETLAVWIGPEGDFTPAEVDAITAAGARLITLGRLVLRSDTAALYCLSVLSHELQAETG